MRADMGGAAVVLASVWAAAKLSLPVNIHAHIPLCDNMPSGEGRQDRCRATFYRYIIFIYSRPVLCITTILHNCYNCTAIILTIASRPYWLIKV